jgi:hypothetical protein
MRNTFLIRLIGLVGVLMCMALSIYYHENRLHEVAARYQYECPLHLIDLWTITMELAKNNDRFPQDLTFIIKKMPISNKNLRLRLSPVLCPASQVAFNANEATADALDYVFLNWSRAFTHVKDVPGDYPLAYDRKLANHVGRGIFVLKVDGSVIWDSDAQWLHNFSIRHPEYRVLIPQ